MIDVVIPLGNGSRWENNEIRYSLRSLEKFGHNVGRVFIVGECPSWLTGVTHIPFADKYGHERNIMEKVKFACEHLMISDNFLFWNDDFFLVDFIDCENYPYFYSGTIADKIGERIPTDGYRKSMENTHRLTPPGHYPRFFDIHCPIIYNKVLFYETMRSVDWSIGNGYVIKSLYGSRLKLGPRFLEMPDLKFCKPISKVEIHKQLEGRHIFSVADQGLFRDMKETLKELYPTPSRYEK